MDLPAPLAWLVDDAGTSAGPDRFLAELGGRLLADGLPLSGGALTLAVPHPIIARRTFLWRAETGAVIEALGFAGAVPVEAGSSLLAGLGPVQEQAVGADSMLGWAGIHPFDSAETHRLRQVARFAAAPLATLAARGPSSGVLRGTPNDGHRSRTVLERGDGPPLAETARETSVLSGLASMIEAEVAAERSGELAFA